MNTNRLKLKGKLQFTFHYGSILITAEFHCSSEIATFTFHYGSILIEIFKDIDSILTTFTFHYGSILIGNDPCIDCVNVHIYIPLWFYSNQ